MALKYSNDTIHVDDISLIMGNLDLEYHVTLCITTIIVLRVLIMSSAKRPYLVWLSRMRLNLVVFEDCQPHTYEDANFDIPDQYFLDFHLVDVSESNKHEVIGTFLCTSIWQICILIVFTDIDLVYLHA